MSLKFHEISEASHRILNPFSIDKLQLLGAICRPGRNLRMLDLASGNGELLCQWSSQYGISGLGVDLSSVFIEKARRRARELNVAKRVQFEFVDAAEFAQRSSPVFNIVSCIGATWIGGGLSGTLSLMKRNLVNASGTLLVGEAFWLEPPPAEAEIELSGSRGMFASLDGTLDRFESAGLELVEMLIASHDDWDRYEASQWAEGRAWLENNEGHPDAADFRDWISSNQLRYLKFGRRYFGWGVFVLRIQGTDSEFGR